MYDLAHLPISKCGQCGRKSFPTNIHYVQSINQKTNNKKNERIMKRQIIMSNEHGHTP
jgi:hypothetical protein